MKTKVTTTAQAMRKIRKLLPDGFKKIKTSSKYWSDLDIWPGYTNGTLRIQVQGICEWRAKSTEKESCVAKRIVISSTHSKLSSRYYSPRRCGTFNFDGIGVKLQEMVITDAAITEEYKRYEQQEEAKKKAAAKLTKELKKLVRQRKWDPHVFDSYRNGKHGESFVRINVRDAGLSISISNLSLEQIDAIMENVA